MANIDEGYYQFATIYTQFSSSNCILKHYSNIISMKQLSILFFVLFISSLSWAQEKMDKRLLERYSQSELSKLKQNNLEEFKILNYALDNGMYIANYSAEKGDVFPEIDRPKKSDTFIDLNLEILEENQYFKIKGEDKMLIVKSKWLLKNEMKWKILSQF